MINKMSLPFKAKGYKPPKRSKGGQSRRDPKTGKALDVDAPTGGRTSTTPSKSVEQLKAEDTRRRIIETLRRQGKTVTEEAGKITAVDPRSGRTETIVGSGTTYRTVRTTTPKTPTETTIKPQETYGPRVSLTQPQPTQQIIIPQKQIGETTQLPQDIRKEQEAIKRGLEERQTKTLTLKDQPQKEKGFLVANPLAPQQLIKVPTLTEAERKLQQARQQVQTGAKSQVTGFVVGVGVSAVGTAKFTKQAVTQPPSKTAEEILTAGEVVGKKIISGEGFPEAGKALKTETAFSAGVITGEIGQAYIGGKVAKATKEFTKRTITRVRPSYRKVVDEPLGTKVIQDIPTQEGTALEMGLIPRGKSPKLDVDVKKLIKQTDIPMKETPKIPDLPPTQKKILEVVKKRGEAVSGSFGQKTLVKGSRGFEDIDIAAKDVAGTTAEIKKTLGKEVIVEKQTITTSPLGEFDINRIIERRTKKVIADVDPIQYAEEGLALKYKPTTVEGIKFIAPEARLGAKALQLGRGRRGKVVTDVGQLMGEQTKVKTLVESAEFRGAFKFTQPEQAAFKGKRVTIATSARDLIQDMGKKIDIETDLYGTPAALGSQRAQTRVSRIIIPQKEATILDLITGDVTFKKQKPQIVFFKDEVIGKQFQPYGKVGSPELEVVLKAGKKIRPVKRQAVTLIEGKVVPIFQAEVVDELPKLTKASRKQISTTPKVRIDRPKPKFDVDIEGFDMGLSYDVMTKPLVSKSGVVGAVTPALSGSLDVDLEKISTVPTVKLYDSPLPTTPSRISGVPTSKPTSPTKKVSGVPSIDPSYPPSIPPSIPPSLPPSPPPPSYPPSVPPSLPPSIPPSIKPPPKKVPPPPPIIIPGLEPKRGKTEKLGGFNVYVKKKQFKMGKKRYKHLGYKKVNVAPLTKNAALGLGAKIVDRYANRTFKIVKAEGRAVRRPDLVNTWFQLKQKFRYSKKRPHLIIEKTDFAIDSFDEVRGIPYESLKTRGGSGRIPSISAMVG